MGIITDIQRFSLHDGPGIRTTVFFKGCNMACDWCHNPETIHFKKELLFYSDNCINCGRCIGVCPTSAITEENSNMIFDRELCNGCMMCAAVCFPEAFIVSGKDMTIEEIMKEILQNSVWTEPLRLWQILSQKCSRVMATQHLFNLNLTPI